jgi:class 3 adenylate cyclase/pimeloyl-ACP methyl ester carboxylesterase
MELNIRYTVTADGVRIAFATAGQGQPVIRAPYSVFSHCQMEWRQSDFFERLARNRMIVPFDPRGAGLSDRDVVDFSIEARMLDIDAVAGALGLEQFAIHGIGSSGPVAISYAVRHAERITHLILDDAFINGRNYLNSPQTSALAQLSDDWEALTENIAFTSMGFGGEEAMRHAEYLRACTTPEAFARWTAAQRQVDVTELLPSVQAPTLILQHRALRYVGPDEGREMATRIPNSRLVVLEGKQGEVEGVLSAIGEFLGDEAGELSPGPRRSESSPSLKGEGSRGGLRTVLFTDIVGHTEMMSRLGDVRGRAVLRGHERITRQVLAAHGGAEVKTMGDGFMASFGSVTAAVGCAVDLQRAFAAQNQEPRTENLQVRVGLNAGEPIEEDGDLFGATVILASRICGIAGAGEILVPETVRGLLSGKGFVFGDRGEFVPKGFDEGVRVWEVVWRE